MADFFWCMMSAQRGWSIEETASKPLEISAKRPKNAHGFMTKAAHSSRHGTLRRLQCGAGGGAGGKPHRSCRISRFGEEYTVAWVMLYHRLKKRCEHQRTENP